MSTAGYAAVAAGEDWHYVGEAGEPAFTNGWDNFTGAPKLAFRIREAGVVDIQGTATGGTPGLSIFTLPTDYRPSTQSLAAATGSVSGSSLAVSAVIGTNGEVTGLSGPSNPDEVSFLGQFFLDAPDVAP